MSKSCPLYNLDQELRVLQSDTSLNPYFLISQVTKETLKSRVIVGPPWRQF